MLKDKVIIITGAAGGIGTAAAQMFAERGARLVLTDIRKDALEETVKNLPETGTKTLLVEHDVTSPESWNALFERVLEEWGRVDVLVNNAGVVFPGAAEEVPLEKVHQQVSVNFLGMIHGCRAAIPVMKRQGAGKIVNVASLGGVVPMPGEAVYSATKFAIRGYTMSLHAELRDTPVGICAVCPDSVDTPQLAYELKFDEAVLSFVGSPLPPRAVAKGILKAVRKKKPEILVPGGMGALYRILMGMPRIFFFVYPLVRKMGKSEMKKRRARIAN